ncbi:MAG: penicillin acylase family protein [Chloroherpetonaceae bacterium]|nr:penicillin acylase family protein [Chloroherpetonaceae bacterium]
MGIKYLKPLLIGFFSVLLIWGFNQRLAGTISISAYLNPLGGALWNAILPDYDAFHPPENFLQSKVSIQRDRRGVAHIFAETIEDLFFAQGYTVASERLWQHDIQIRAASGRLSEILGEQTLDYDRFMRRIGLKVAAEKSYELSIKDSLMKVVLESYSKGYNAYLSSLHEPNYPVEFKLLGYRPENYTPLNCFLMQSNLTYDLTYRNNDRAYEEFCEIFGDSLANELFPMYSPLNVPFADAPMLESKQTEKPDQQSSVLKMIDPLFMNVSALSDELWEWDNPYQPRKGSNNWAIAGGSTETGNPILCNDPHLTLTLPSIWIEMQLVLKSKTDSLNFNSYGVTTAGIPSIILGFNKHIAWGATNAGSDILDWYQVERNPENQMEYLWQGQYKRFSERIEPFIVRGTGITKIDTILESQIGPLVARKGEPKLNPNFVEEAVMHWGLYHPNNSLKGIFNLNRAKNIDEALSALEGYTVPAQNFAISDTSGRVAIRHNGKFLKRNKENRNGSRLLSLNSYHESPSITYRELPTRFMNSSGFVFSANQNPVDSSYPYYLGWDYASMERGTRIKQQLEKVSSQKMGTRENMKSLQLDDFNLYAKELLPLFLQSIHSSKFEVKPHQKEILMKLEKWNYRYQSETIEPTVFELWSSLFYREYWDWVISKSSLRPSRDVTLSRIQTLFSKSVEKEVEIKELGKKIFFAFQLAIDSLSKTEEIQPWGKRNPVEIRHQARLPGFGTAPFAVSGSYNTVNAVNRNHGPSWRIVVEHSKTGIPIAEVSMPGGVSGKPHSKFYDSGVQAWANGEYFKVLYLTSPDSTLVNFSIMNGRE